MEEKENTYPQTSESQTHNKSYRSQTPMKANKVQKDIPSTEKTKQRQRNSKLAPPTLQINNVDHTDTYK